MRLVLLYVLIISQSAFAQHGKPTKEQAHQKYIEILNSEGVESALLYIDQYFEQSQDQKTIYYIGWAEFLRGNYSASKRITEYLEHRANKEDLLAATYYLMGQICLYDSDPQTKAAEKFEMSKTIYSKIGLMSGVYRCEIGLALAYLAESDLDIANSHHMKAFRVAIKHDLGFELYHSAGHQLQLALGNYELSLEHLRDELKIHQTNNNRGKMHQVYLHLATGYLILGEKHKATEFNDLAVAFYQETGDKTRVLHGKINQYFISGCERHSEINIYEINELPGYILSYKKALEEKLCE